MADVVIVRAGRSRSSMLMLGSSIAALVVASPALAQCNPDPTVTSGTTTCTGNDTDGLSIAGDSSRVTVQAGASVRNGSGGAAVTSTGYYGALIVAGTIDGGAAAGVSILNGPYFPGGVNPDPYAGASPNPYIPAGYRPGRLDVQVNAGGSIAGDIAIRVDAVPGATATGTIVNAGTLTGTSETAVATARGGTLQSLRNEATGTIAGSIEGAINIVSNEGAIRAGDRSVIASIASGQYTVLSVANGGSERYDATAPQAAVIANASAAATIAMPEGYVTNTGIIRNAGRGAAIATTGALNLVNGTAATIASGGATAITSGGAVTIANRGTITGSVVSTATSGNSSVDNSSVDNSSGTIVGDVRLGAGDDLLRARYAEGRISNITGAIDGGAGTDTIILGIVADATLGNGALPTNFERLGVALSNRATVTLAADLNLRGGVLTEGTGFGTLVNLTTLTAQGQAIAPSSFGYNSISIVNRGTITATLATPFVAAVQTGGSVSNEGTITVVGGAGVLSQGYAINNTFTNSGTITATGTGADVNGRVVNSGTLRSTAGTGLRASYASAPSSNSGTIEGATSGVELTSTSLVNTGTIRGGRIGLAANGYAVVDNQAGGVIAGATAIAGSYYVGTRVRNAGRIDGDVDLRGYGSAQSLFVDAGGTVNGAVQFGDGDDVFVTAFDTAGTRPLGGASGGVGAGGGTNLLVYRVSADTTAQIPAPVAGFRKLGFEVDQGATLTLTSSLAAPPLSLAGSGMVDLTADYAVTNQAALDLSMATTEERLSATGASDDLPPLSVISRGTISLTAARSNPYFDPRYAAVNADGARFENAGTINVTGVGNDPYDLNGPIGIGGGDVVNSGAINLRNAATGISAEYAVNTGTITGAAGSAATGVAGGASIDNRGSVVVDGYAVRGGYGTAIVNSGLLESRTQAAVYFSDTGGSIVNRAGGTVRGGGRNGVAIEGSGAVVNEGTISGSVQFGFTRYAYGGSAYVAAGGVLNGDLVFDFGNDLLVLRGTSFGVTGQILDFGGYNTYGVSLTADGTVAVDTLVAPAGFEGRLVEAAGAGTTVTVTSARTLDGIALTGSGTIVNRANVDGFIDTGVGVPLGALTTDRTIGSLVNEATVNGGIYGGAGNFTNTGTIVGADYQGAVVLESTGSFVNSGVIRESRSGEGAIALTYSELTDGSFRNSGDVAGSVSMIANADASASDGTVVTGPKTLALTNSGSISAIAAANDAVGVNIHGGADPATLTIANSGTLTASGQSADALSVYVTRAAGATTIAVNNSGTISSSGPGRTDVIGGTRLSTALSLEASADIPVPPGWAPVVLGAASARIVNAAGATIAAPGALSLALRGSDVSLDIDNQGSITGGGAGAIVSAGARDDIVRNGGRITGLIDLGDGSDRVENRGTITGDVRLGAGDDGYLHLATATLGGVADGGDGTDVVTIEAAGSGGAVSGDRFVNFERLMQVGSGRADYAGMFTVPAIELTGGTLGVLAGQTLATAGATTITGGDAGVTIDNAGTIAGDVRLGSGDDRFVERAGSRAGRIDGGAGIDTYEAALTGDRTGIGARVAFERLAVTGAGTLTLTADQAWDAITLAGNGLDLRLAGFSIARIDGSDAAERLTLDGSVGSVSLGGGADVLTLTGSTLAGRYDGGAGADRLDFGATGPVTLTGTATGFETVTMVGDTLTVAGTLGSAGAALGFGDGAQALTVASGGTLAGSIDLGAGDDRLAIAGAFAGAVDGGTGSDAIEVAGGSAAAPVAFSTIANVEAFRMAGGYATVSGTATLGAAELTGGRLVGLAGSTIAAATIAVRQGATFGSAGTVNANLAVAGTLSPGASPGTMTVNGNVALASGSTSLFEITPTVSDKLLVSGAVTIASGATLQLVAADAIRPGTSLDLIVANGGISGSFSTVTKPASLFGFVTQDATRIRLLGQFQTDAALPANIRGAIDSSNATIAGGAGSAAFLAALPQLVTSAGATSVAGFAQITPEPYASARQMAVENGLLLASTARGAAFTPDRDTPGAFVFGQALGNRRRLEGDADTGVARAKSDGWGALAGIGLSKEEWSLGAFGGYLDSRQTLRGRGARTKANGAVVGVSARYAAERIGVTATVAYSGGDADTRRTVPGGTLGSSYGLHAWTGDLSASYRHDLSDAWSLQSRLGATVVRATRGGLAETGGSAFALSVRRDRNTAAFVDGGLDIGSAAPSAPLRLLAHVGARWQVAGRASLATAALGGGGFSLIAQGVERARVLGTAALGLEADVTSGVTLFGSANAERGSGERDEAIRGGLRVAF